MIASVILDHPGQRWIDGNRWETAESIAEEVPVALVYNGISHAIVMATPQDLEDFALGFSLTEGILQSPRELLDCTEQYAANGIRMELTITRERFADLRARRGNFGFSRPLQPVNMKGGISSAAIYRATANLPAFQDLTSFMVEDCCGGRGELCAPVAGCKPSRGKRARLTA